MGPTASRDNDMEQNTAKTARPVFSDASEGVMSTSDADSARSQAEFTLETPTDRAANVGHEGAQQVMVNEISARPSIHVALHGNTSTVCVSVEERSSPPWSSIPWQPIN